jgi:hypothetical protein
MKKVLLKKGFVIWIIALLVTIYISPAYANENTKDEVFSVKLNLVDSERILCQDNIELSLSEIKGLKDRLSTIIENLQSSRNENEILEIFESLLDFNEYPFLSNILEQLLQSGFLFDGNLIFSQGWGYNFNPLKKSEIDFIKTIYFWRYTDSANPINMPSSTGILSMDPFQVKTFIGNQMGFMLRFRGVHIHIDRSYPMGSFTVFLGSARHVGGFEITPLSSYFPM